MGFNFNALYFYYTFNGRKMRNIDLYCRGPREG